MAPSPAASPPDLSQPGEGLTPRDNLPAPPGLIAFRRLEHLVRALDRDATVAEVAFILDLDYGQVLELIRAQDDLAGDCTVSLVGTVGDPVWLWTVYARRTAP